jgi:cytochrome c oxidase cbb3-type subunit 3
MFLLLPACEREQRRFDTPPSAASSAGALQQSALHPGPSASAASAAHAAASDASSPASAVRTAQLVPAGANPHEQNAYAVAQGKRLFRWYNCSGCHANGGGSIGPPLMDDKWIYGSEPAQIVATILQGRPNGMPSFAGRIPEDQAWQIAAYVRSMSGQLKTDVAPNRSDSMSAGPPESRRDKLAPRTQEPAS